MADIQKYFRLFNDKIKLTDVDHNKELRDKRDIVINKLRERLKKIFEDKNEKTPTFKEFNQGSYAMSTGVKPLTGDYDIDVGLRFNLSKDDYPDPLTVKKWVFEALEGHTNEVKMKNPCITVQYQKDNEPLYHVDLAVYSADNSDNKLYLARGPKTESKNATEWEISEPLELIDKVKNHFDDLEDREQFRRIIRYLKRWKDLNFSSRGNAAPVGVGLTIAALNCFSPNKKTDYFSNKTEYNDLAALKDFLNSLINQFVYTYHDGESTYRLKINLPVAPYNEVFKKMSNNQMEQFKKKMEKLLEAVKKADNEVDPRAACLLLNKNHAFGDDFPIPEKSETGEQKKQAFVPSSASA